MSLHPDTELNYLEIGSNWGTSLALVATLIQSYGGRVGQLVSIDPYFGDGVQGTTFVQEYHDVAHEVRAMLRALPRALVSHAEQMSLDRYIAGEIAGPDRAMSPHMVAARALYRELGLNVTHHWAESAAVLPALCGTQVCCEGRPCLPCAWPRPAARPVPMSASCSPDIAISCPHQAHVRIHLARGSGPASDITWFMWTACTHPRAQQTTQLACCAPCIDAGCSSRTTCSRAGRPTSTVLCAVCKRFTPPGRQTPTCFASRAATATACRCLRLLRRRHRLPSRRQRAIGALHGRRTSAGAPRRSREILLRR